MSVLVKQNESVNISVKQGRDLLREGNKISKKIIEKSLELESLFKGVEQNRKIKIMNKVKINTINIEQIDFNQEGFGIVKLPFSYWLEEETKTEVTYIYQIDGGEDYTITLDKEDILNQLIYWQNGEVSKVNQVIEDSIRMWIGI